MTSAKGRFSNCGPGLDYELQHTCSGPACSSFSRFPKAFCIPSGGAPVNSFVYNNSVKCPGGISNYQSNFTFTQAAPDAYNPPQNAADSKAQQQQDVILPDCRSFVVKSDGTADGTTIQDSSNADCPIVSMNPQQPFATTIRAVQSVLDSPGAGLPSAQGSVAPGALNAPGQQNPGPSNMPSVPSVSVALVQGQSSVVEMWNSCED